ncbi:uncharacterized protein LOC141673339 [Apium graveolens]|uniref:uncharacterized protein LOC141673339 n=1 Tax=Apium graveolens TaxID=4045 RepID=UPI003D7BB80C
MVRQSPEKMEESSTSMFSPRFRSVAEMAGWDEETLLVASLVVEDTPDRLIKHNRRTHLHLKTSPPSNSTRKRRLQRRSPASVPVTLLHLDVADETPNKGSEKKKKQVENTPTSCNKKEDSAAIPCMDKLREELSCAICLEICFEPSTTPCGHSFCKKCLRSAADKCGKRCPKCRQLISNGRSSCTVNTVLWNTIQLLFPKEVEARKLAGTADTQESKQQRLATRNRDRRVIPLALNDDLETELESSARRRSNQNLRNRASGILTRRASEDARNRVRRREQHLAVQDEDAALALRLQREEFMEAFRPSDEQPAAPQQQRNSSTHVARANLRAIASRAMNIRVRGRQN